jgi:chromosome segregation ATPase
MAPTQQAQSAEVEVLREQLQQALASAEEERTALAGEVQALSRQAALRELELASLRAQLAAAQERQAGSSTQVKQQQQEEAPHAAMGAEQRRELSLTEADLVARLQSALEERGNLQVQLAAAQAQLGQLQQQLAAASASLAGPAAGSASTGVAGLEGKRALAQARVEAGEAR